MNQSVTIVGAGLAGCVTAWQLHRRGVPFSLCETHPERAGSLVAAGMLAPITGKGLNPSWLIDDFYPDALAFYREIEFFLNAQYWYDYPVNRLFFHEKDRRKFERKLAQKPEVAKWVDSIVESIPGTLSSYGAVVWKGSGRLDVGKFVRESREFFRSLGCYIEREIVPATDQLSLYTTGAAGLIEATPMSLPHRSAKGEILKVRIAGLRQDQIVSRGTWIVPSGEQNETFLVGANYEWDDLTNQPTSKGREAVLKGLESLIDLPYEVLEHRAGVRPIVRCSQPVIGKISQKNGYMMNGLGSKGVLYAPRVANLLLDTVFEGATIPSELQVANALR